MKYLEQNIVLRFLLEGSKVTLFLTRLLNEA